MKNLRELFTEYHARFQDFGPWLKHHREMQRRHPLGCTEFGEEWLRRWEAVGRLFGAKAYVEVKFRHYSWMVLDAAGPGTVALCARYCNAAKAEDERQGFAPSRRRIVLLDGTIIREWGPK